jgi:poly(hydroxyalkanoate) depolymerase family esterase
MNRHHVLAVASISLGLLLAAPVRAASLTQVNRSDWTGGVNLPSYLQMYIYVPAKVASKPPIVVSGHSCGSTASGQMGNIPKTQAAADSQGFILVLPDNPNQNCWDVGSAQSLKHDGGGDTQGVALMVKYALTKYNGDPGRVYIFGGSSGGMLTQAMLAVYPDVFRAGTARAGVPAGCWADGYASSNQWSNNCAGGNTTKTASQWGEIVRAMYPGYTGHRPRVQTMQGEADTTISYKNTAESIKEWTNVLGLSTTPTSTDTGYKAANATYDRQFWKNACGYTVLEAWSSPGGTHSMAYEEADILKFFGLDTAGGSDPEPDCSGDGGVAGTGGVSGSGGTTGAGGTGGARDGGRDGGSDVGLPGGGGVQGSGGSSGSGAAVGTGGRSAGTGGRSGSGGAVGTGGGAVGTGGSAAGTGGNAGSGGTSDSGSGGAVGTGGSVGSGGSSAKGGSGGEGSGGMQGSGGSAAQGGNSGSGGSTATLGGTSANGCSCTVGSRGERSAFQGAALLLAGLAFIFRRHRRARR